MNTINNNSIPTTEQTDIPQIRPVNIISNDSKNNVKPINSNMLKKKNPKKIILVILVILFLIGLLGFIGIYLPVKKLMSSVNDASLSAKEIMTAAKKQDVTKTGEKIKITQEKITKVKTNLQSLSWLKVVPIANRYYTDGTHMVNAAGYGLDAGQIIVESISPYADLLGLKGQGSFVMGSAEERIKKAVQTMDKVTPRLKDIDNKLILVQKEIKEIDPNRYDFDYKGKNLKVQIAQAKNLIQQSTIALSDARPVFELLPKLLGEPKPARYLVIFQNDKELRSTGGFMTAYAIFRFDEGIVHVEKSDDIYNLDASIANKPSAPEPIMKYLQLRDQVWHLRDTNISPDFVVSMNNFEKILANSTSNFDYQGIITVDTQFLAKVLNVLGGVEAYGTKFTTDIIPACNCPQVVYELEKYADQPVGYERGSRKDMIGVLLYSIMNKAFSSSPKLYWGKLFQTGLDALAEKHVLIRLNDPKAQKGIEVLGYGGRIKNYNGDYLHINDTNLGGAKSNMFVAQSVDSKVEIKDNGQATVTLNIDYKNPFPADDCNLEHGKLCLNAPLRDWFRVYLPKGSQLVDSKGSEVKITTYEDLGKTVVDGFLQVRPMGSAKLTIKYNLPLKINRGEDYKLLIQKQPGTEGADYKVTVDGQVQKFKLTTDKELIFKL